MGISPFVAALRGFVGHQLLLLPSVAVLPWREDGRLLCVRLADTAQWATIGGAVEPDESPEDAARRETEEEAGIRVELQGIRAVLGGPPFRIRYPNGDETAYVSTVFDASITSGVPQPDHDETTAIGWFSPTELVGTDMSPFTRALLIGARVIDG